MTFLGVNQTKGVLKDSRIRRAISLAIDKKALAKVVLDGRAVANDQIVAPGVAGFVKGFDGTGYSPSKAKKLLAEAGYSGQSIPLEYATSGRIPLSSEIAQAIGGYLKAVGIDVDLVGMDQASLSAKIYGTVNMAGLYLNTWAPSTMDGDMPASNLFGGGQNDYAKSPALAALVKDQRTVAGADRLADFEKIARTNADDADILPLFTPKADYAVNSTLSWTPRVDGEFVVSDIHTR
ncbi:hypothetical protein GCM10025867_05600 [Frondihabitans sucicola]|uniref:Solute-binding protein family 5 domain-containing protein n=1 Tax=Frondihabitans sucicola TaxID=1268041 RepID=A0ABN6XTM2_9MICO|nr:hypothetical protein GCM10025867_05600 [Frondihabitans sucicola]